MKAYGGIYTPTHRKLAVGEGYPHTPNICPDTPDIGIWRLQSQINFG
jgi:hypothetical protein